jgi:hypothetical protein
LSSDEWAVSLASSPGLTRSQSAFERFAEALDQIRDVRGRAAVSVDTQNGVLGTSFKVRAGTRGEAASIAVAAFFSALDSASIDTARVGHLTIEVRSAAEAEAEASALLTASHVERRDPIH